MADVLTSNQRHHNMAAIHSDSTRPELALRHSLWHLGFRYRVNDRRFPGTPDIVLPKYRTVIFVHGCFWHGHNNCKYYTIPKTNVDFWTSKVSRNKERDQRVWRKLEAKGWYVIVVWECQLKKACIDDTIACVEGEIKANGEAFLRIQAERREAMEAYRKERQAIRDREASLLAEIRIIPNHA